MKISSPLIDHFTETAGVYDERNRQLAPITESMHLLIRLILKNVPFHARVLCVGVGTGSEILSLAQTFPEWTFVGVDPSIGMLGVCRKRLNKAGILDRCELINGYIDDVPEEDTFSAILSLLVAHFVNRDDRLNFYQGMCDRLCSNGILITTELSYDLNLPEFPLLLKNWMAVQSLMGATPESLASLSSQLHEMLTIISPEETEMLLIKSGITVPVHFFQAFLISGWYGIKNSQPAITPTAC